MADYIRCACGLVLGVRYDNGDTEFSTHCRIVNHQRLCLKCADEAENMREMGYGPYKVPPRPDTIGKSGEEARRMEEKLEKYPPVPDSEREEGDYTFLSVLKRKRVIDPVWAVEVLTTHALATHDINAWLDTLNNPEADEAARAEAMQWLKETAPEYRELCEKRAEVMEKIQTPADDNGIKVTWRVS